MIKKLLFIAFLGILNSNVYAEFEKEVKLIDEGKCEEALAENAKTSIEQEENFNPKKLFVDKHTIKIFRIYSLNRKIKILDKNCNKKKEAFELAKKSLKLEKELSKIPLKEIDKVLKYDDFQRKINLAGAHTQLANLYNTSELKNKIKLYEKNIEILESTDLYKEGNLLNYNYSILAFFYNKNGDLKKASLFKNKHLKYMEARYGLGTSKYINALISLYELYYDQGYYDNALEVFLKVKETIDLESFYKDDDQGDLKFYHQLATIYYKNNDNDNAIKVYKENLSLIKSKRSLSNNNQTKDDLLRWEVLTLSDLALNIHNKYYTTGNDKYLDEAEKLYLQNIKISEISNLESIQRDLFITKDNLTAIYLARSKFEKALPMIEENYTSCIKSYSEKNEKCLTQMITLASVTSTFDLPKSIKILEKFLDLEPKTNNNFLRQRVNARNALSGAYESMGKFKKSEELALESINLIDPSDTRFRDTYINSMNSYYLQIAKSGQFKDAIEGWLDLLNFIDKESNQKWLSGSVLNNLGYAFSFMDRKKSLEYYLKAEKICTKYGLPRLLTTVRMNLADSYYKLKNYKKTSEYYKLALEYKFTQPYSKILLYSGLSRSEALNKNHDQSLMYANEGLKVAKDHLGINHPSSLPILDSLVLVHHYKKNYDEKFKYLTNIYNIINDYSNGYLVDNSNFDPIKYTDQILTFIYAASEKIGDKVKKLNVVKNEDKKFKIFFEKNSLNSMNDAIFNLTETLRTTKVSIDTNRMISRNFYKDANKQKKLRYLDSRIEEYSKLPKFASDNKEKKELLIKVNNLKKEIENLKKELELGKFLKGDSFIYQDIQVNKIQNSLNDDEVILHYILGSTNLFLGLVSKNDFKLLYSYHQNKNIPNLIKKIRSSINYNNGVLSKFDHGSSKELYDILIKPFEKDIAGKKKLIVVPHGPLLSMPFEVLINEIPKENSLQNTNWLIKDYNIKYHPSVSSFYFMNKDKSKKNKSYFAGYGDPVLTKSNKDVVLNSKVSKNLFSRGGLADIERIKELPELPKTSYELKEISKNFDNKELFLRKDFNEKNIKAEELSKYSVISFATHGIIANEIDGVFEPGLITSPPNKAGEIDDGVLTSSEIKKLNLNTELIILSACNTAASDGSANSEGLSGLASSFFYAGAKSLLVSHWYVEDETTVNLMKNTFNNFKKTDSISESLRNVKINMINESKTSHPIFWAPFILIGG